MMDLEGRELEFDLCGEDVGLPHSKLAQIGQQVPDEKRQHSYFGQKTCVSVIQEHQLEPIAVVDTKPPGPSILNEIRANVILDCSQSEVVNIPITQPLLRKVPSNFS